MATLRSDIVIPEIFTPYLEEATTQRSAFLQSGIITAEEAYARCEQKALFRQFLAA